MSGSATRATPDTVDLVVPVKPLDRAKSRLRGAAAADHAELVLALLVDTVQAATATPVVRRVLVVSSDDLVADTVRSGELPGAEWTPDQPDAGLNAALRHGAALLRSADPGATIGVLQADLPALRPAELSQAVTEADGRRAFCADHLGTGTTLLLSGRAGELDPRFGPGSAAAHLRSGAVPIGRDLPSLRCDVDTAADLVEAGALGVGRRTSALLASTTAVSDSG